MLQPDAATIRPVRSLDVTTDERINSRDTGEDVIHSAHARFTVAVPTPNFSAVSLMLAPFSARHALMAS